MKTYHIYTLLMFLLALASCKKQEPNFGPLKVSHISPAIGMSGDTIEISGSGFDPERTQQKVFFTGGLEAKPIVSAKSDKLVIIVPGDLINQPLSGPLKIVLGSDTLITAESFTVTDLKPKPTIDSLKSSPVQAGSFLSLFGKFLGLDQDLPGYKIYIDGQESAGTKVLSASTIPSRQINYGELKVQLAGNIPAGQHHIQVSYNGKLSDRLPLITEAASTNIKPMYFSYPDQSANLILVRLAYDPVTAELAETVLIPEFDRNVVTMDMDESKQIVYAGGYGLFSYDLKQADPVKTTIYTPPYKIYCFAVDHAKGKFYAALESGELVVGNADGSGTPDIYSLAVGGFALSLYLNEGTGDIYIGGGDASGAGVIWKTNTRDPGNISKYSDAPAGSYASGLVGAGNSIYAVVTDFASSIGLYKLQAGTAPVLARDLTEFGTGEEIANAIRYDPEFGYFYVKVKRASGVNSVSKLIRFKADNTGGFETLKEYTFISDDLFLGK